MFFIGILIFNHSPKFFEFSLLMLQDGRFINIYFMLRCLLYELEISSFYNNILDEKKKKQLILTPNSFPTSGVCW